MSNSNYSKENFNGNNNSNVKELEEENGKLKKDIQIVNKEK